MKAQGFCNILLLSIHIGKVFQKINSTSLRSCHFVASFEVLATTLTKNTNDACLHNDKIDFFHEVIERRNEKASRNI